MHYDTKTYAEAVAAFRAEYLEREGEELADAKLEMYLDHSIPVTTPDDMEIRCWDDGSYTLEGREIHIDVFSPYPSQESLAVALRRIADFLDQGYTGGHEPCSWRTTRGS